MSDRVSKEKRKRFNLQMKVDSIPQKQITIIDPKLLSFKKIIKSEFTQPKALSQSSVNQPK